jgi:hypothetical protein
LDAILIWTQYVCTYIHTYIHVLGVAGAAAERAGAVTDAGTGVIQDKGGTGGLGGEGASKCPFAALLAQEGGEV